VDVSIPEAFAKVCKSAGIVHFSMVSAVNSAAKAMSRFGRTKFKAEQACKVVDFQ
jgi:hypothetical protein